MKENQVSKFLISFNGNIEYVRFPAGVFDDNLYLQYDVVWGPDWEPLSGLRSGTSQIARSGNDPEKVIFNMPLEMTFASTNIYGWPQIVISIRARNFFARESLRGYALFHFPPVTGTQELVAHIIRPRSATFLGEWISWITGRNPELVDPKILASGQENYLLRTESYGTVVMRMTMVSKDLRKLGYDNQPSYKLSMILEEGHVKHEDTPEDMYGEVDVCGRGEVCRDRSVWSFVSGYPARNMA